MTGLYAVEVEPEVRSWLERLSDRDFGRADFLVGLLAEEAGTLGEPYTRHPGGKVRELSVPSAGQATAHHLLARTGPPDHPADSVPQDSQRRGSRGHPCLQAQKTCEAEHGAAHDTFDREASKHDR
jgi:hypothetical protein